MTEQEAIENLKHLFSEYELDLPNTDSLETLQLAISALEKQTAKKPHHKAVHRQMSSITTQIVDIYTCGCHNTFDKSYRYCPNCGQRMDWSEI